MKKDEMKKPPTEVDDLSKSNVIIADYLKFVKGDKTSAMQVLLEIGNKDILLAVLEHIAMRFELGKKQQMTARAIQMLMKNLNNICDLQGIVGEQLRDKVKVLMLNKASNAKWLSVFPLSTSELALLKVQKKTTSYDVDKIKKRINNFD